MMSDGHEVPICAFEETWISIQRFNRHICSKFQIVPKWVPRKSLTKHYSAKRNKAYLRENLFIDRNDLNESKRQTKWGYLKLDQSHGRLTGVDLILLDSAIPEIVCFKHDVDTLI